MPGKRLEVDQQERLPKYAIVGTYSTPQAGNFVNHVGLLREETSASFGANVSVWHTAPPVVAGDRTSRMVAPDFERIEVCAAAFLDSLSISETKAIETALDRIDGLVRELPPRCKGSSKRARAAGFTEHYTACPAVDWGRDKTTGRRRHARFSYAGFVAECYRRAGINLVDETALTEEPPESLPPVNLATVVEQYGDSVNSPENRARIGLNGDGPWRLLLPGYLMHSVAREPGAVRGASHIPRIEDAEFPRP